MSKWNEPVTTRDLCVMLGIFVIVVGAMLVWLPRL